VKEGEESNVPAFMREAWEESGSGRELLDETMVLFETSSKHSSVPDVSRLLAQVEAAPLRHAPFFRRVAEMFETSEHEIELLLGPNDWKKAPLPGIRFKEFAGAKNRVGQTKTVVMFSPRTRFPHHGHQEHESLLILEGGYTDDQGKHYGPGDLHNMAPGTEHGFVIDADGPCIAASVADEKIQFTSFWMRSLAKLVGR
jgi:anti-sigma factor ChrR (cupin superfamily)